MPMSEEQQRSIIDALKVRGVNRPCPRCGNVSFTLVDGYLNQIVQQNIGGIVIGGPTVPSVITTCNKCGFLSQHALGALGLLPKEMTNG